jgi:hypothetical protein
VEIWEGGVFGPSILYSRSTLNTESEYIHIDYDSNGHVFDTIAETFNLFLYLQFFNILNLDYKIKIYQKSEK